MPTQPGRQIPQQAVLPESDSWWHFHPEPNGERLRMEMCSMSFEIVNNCRHEDVGRGEGPAVRVAGKDRQFSVR